VLKGTLIDESLRLASLEALPLTVEKIYPKVRVDTHYKPAKVGADAGSTSW